MSSNQRETGGDGVLGQWDPLAEDKGDIGILAAAKKREIQNILKSYTGYYDLFAELVQNALDAVERRMREEGSAYKPAIWVTIDLRDDSVTVTDNGCGMNMTEFKSFLRPNFSFKDGVTTRGSKGVGATYLAYGFNHLSVATKQKRSPTYKGVLTDGRKWLDDSVQIINRPLVADSQTVHPDFEEVDCGTSMTVRLVGDNIRPHDLRYYKATTAEQWMAILRVHTSLGGIYLCGETPPDVIINLKVFDVGNDEPTKQTLFQPQYLYPHTVLGRTADLREFLADQEKRASQHLDISKIPARFAKLNGIWGEWTGDSILNGQSPIKPRLDESEQRLVKELGVSLYVFLGFSTELWDDYNDKVLSLRKGSRLLRGGLQQATRHMAQGHTITIPLTESIGFQNLSHIIVHFENAEPDLGRKGFQPEHTRLAEKISASAVTSFKKYYDRLLRKKTGAPALLKKMSLGNWIDEQREFERKFPLVITGRGLFAPTEELAIRSMPQREQDVVALFNQMLSSGLVRGIQLLSSSQYNQYDGLFRYKMDPPFDKYVRSVENPLGVDAQVFAGVEQPIESPVQVLEYKFNLDALMEEFSTAEKNPDDISLVVAWELGDKWRGNFDIISFLDDGNVHHRECHGLTHSFSHAIGGNPAFQGIILKDLVNYCLDPRTESLRQQKLYSAEEIEE